MKYFLFILVFCSVSAAAQNFDMEKDTIQMKEVVVTKNGKKFRMKTLHLTGPCYAPEAFKDASEIVTLVEGLPSGSLESVTFYLNGVFETKEQSGPASFGVVIYTVDEDNKPGQRIAYDEKAMVINEKAKGKVTVNIAGHDVNSRKKLFIGLLKESGPAVVNDLFLDCLCNGHDKYMTIARAAADKPWERRWVCAGIRVDVGVVLD